MPGWPAPRRDPPAYPAVPPSRVRAQEEQVETMVDTLYIRLAEVTGREVDEIRAGARHGRFLTVPEAIAYGLLDGEAGPGDMRRGGQG